MPGAGKYLHNLKDICCCGVSMGLGDALCQHVTRKKEPINWERTRRMSLIGFTTSGSFSLLVHRSLEHFFPGTSARSILRKSGLQTLIAPFQIATTFMTNLWYSGETNPMVYKAKLNDVIPTYLYGFLYWPGIHWILFHKVNPSHRVMFHSLASVFWSGFVSMVANNKRV